MQEGGALVVRSEDKERVSDVVIEPTTGHALEGEEGEPPRPGFLHCSAKTRRC
jgi:hypothetical protein